MSGPRTLAAIALIAMSFLPSVAHALVDPQATPATRDLYALLQRLNAEDGAAFGGQYSTAQGIHPDGTPWKYYESPSEILPSDIRNMCGILPAVSGWDFNEFLFDGPERRAAILRSIRLSSDLGILCCLSFHEKNPATGGDAWDAKIELKELLPGGKDHERFKADWAAAADAIAGMVRSDGTAVPLLLRPFHECSGDWFWWGTDEKDADFIALWRWLVTYLRDTRGLHNILYVYNTDRVDSKEQYLARWPGDGWADVASCDAYLPDAGSDKRLLTPLSIVAEVAAEKGLPAALAEVGCNAKGGMAGSHRADWWTARVLEPIRKAGLFPRIAWIAGWANWIPEHCYMPWPGDKSAPDYVRFLRSKEIFLLDHISPAAVRMTHPHLGEIDTRNYPWVYGENHGWEYMFATFNPKGGEEWFYDAELGRLWTSDAVHPYFWSEKRGWIYYGGTEGGLRRFYSNQKEEWFSVPVCR
jgi:mannan endo-1,4-beta-mannosidase